MAAEGYLRAKQYLRKVFLQDMPFIEKFCPAHPIFQTRFFLTHKNEWERWRNMLLEFHDRMEGIEREFIAPPLPIVGPVVGMQMATVNRWLQELTKETLATHGLQESLQQVMYYIYVCFILQHTITFPFYTTFLPILHPLY